MKIVEAIGGIFNQVIESLIYAGGLSSMAKRHFLNPLIDNSDNAGCRHYRTLNLFYYFTPNWDEACGGNLKPWDRRVSTIVRPDSCFNRLVPMQTTPRAWLAVSSVQNNGLRKCVSNYYFSARLPIGENYFNITESSVPPKHLLFRLWRAAYAGLRQFMRKIKPEGLGPEDVYQGPPR